MTDKTSAGSSNPLGDLLRRLCEDGGRYLLLVGMTREEIAASPAPTFRGKANKRWLTDEEYAALCALAVSPSDETFVQLGTPADETIDEIAKMLKAAGWRATCDAQWDGLRSIIPHLATTLGLESPAYVCQLVETLVTISSNKTRMTASQLSVAAAVGLCRPSEKANEVQS